MGAVAVGLICYGVFTKVKARYRQVTGDSMEETYRENRSIA